MGTVVQRIYPVATDQDQAWGTTVFKLDETNNADNSATQTLHPNAAGTTDITIKPHTTNSVASDITSANGWAWDEASSEGMGSVAAAKRLILAGTWTFQFRVTVPAAGTATGSHTASFVASVYRVATGGGARTLLFTTARSSTVVTSTTLTVTGNCLIAHSASEIILEAGETILVGILARNVQAAGLAGATTAGTLTWITGTTGPTYVEVSTPGVRTYYRRTPDLSNLAAAGMSGVVAAPAKYVRLIAARTTGTMVGAASAARRLDAFKAFAATSVGTPTVARAVTLARSFSATTLGTATRGSLFIRKAVFTATTLGTATQSRLIQLARSATLVGVATKQPVTIGKSPFTATTIGVTGFSRAVIAVRNFAATAMGVASGRVEMPFTALNRITSGGPTDWSPNDAAKLIGGVVRNAAGTAYSGATVQLVRESDGFVAASTTSAGDGSYSFTRGTTDPYTYRVLAWEDTGTPTQGVSARGLVPA